MPVPKGTRVGGRKKGTPNKSTAEAHEIMDRLGCDPISNMAAIADHRVPCGTCIDKNRKPTGKTKYKLPEGKHAKTCDIFANKPTSPVCTCEGIGERTCESCFGTLWERISVDTALKANSELAQYRHAKRRAVEHTGTGGEPIQHVLKVVYENGPRRD